jgi:hypothetical protein
MTLNVTYQCLDDKIICHMTYCPCCLRQCKEGIAGFSAQQHLALSLWAYFAGSSMEGLGNQRVNSSCKKGYFQLFAEQVLHNSPIQGPSSSHLFVAACKSGRALKDSILGLWCHVKNPTLLLPDGVSMVDGLATSVHNNGVYYISMLQDDLQYILWFTSYSLSVTII